MTPFTIWLLRFLSYVVLIICIMPFVHKLISGTWLPDWPYDYVQMLVLALLFSAGFWESKTVIVVSEDQKAQLDEDIAQLEFHPMTSKPDKHCYSRRRRLFYYDQISILNLDRGYRVTYPDRYTKSFNKYTHS